MSTQPDKPAFPEYVAAGLTADCRAHLLGAATCWKVAHEALLLGDLKLARIELDKVIAIATEARKML